MKWLLRNNPIICIRYLVEFGVISSSSASGQECIYNINNLPDHLNVLLQEESACNIEIKTNNMNDFEPLEFTITELYKLPIHNNICNLWKCLPVSNTIINVKQYIVRGSIRNIFNNPDILILID